jgi:hypothetical protein
VDIIVSWPRFPHARFWRAFNEAEFGKESMTLGTFDIKAGSAGWRAVEEAIGAPDRGHPLTHDGLMTATLAAGWRPSLLDQTGVP